MKRGDEKLSEMNYDGHVHVIFLNIIFPLIPVPVFVARLPWYLTLEVIVITGIENSGISKFQLVGYSLQAD